MKDFRKRIKFLEKQFLRPDLLFVPIVLVIILSVFVTLGIFEKTRYLLLSMNSSPIQNYRVKDLPFLKNRSDPSITAQAAIIMDKDSRTILYEKNQNLRFSPASTTKIMTALLALDFYKPSDMLAVKEATKEGSILGLLPGKRMTFENLLYAMMLPSANDAAFVIAQNYPGGYTKFVEKMNEKTRDLNLPNTHFEDPAGLLDKNDYTTAVELAHLASFALDNKIFAKIVSTPKRLIKDESGNSYLIFNRNKLLGIEGVNGVKTGTTEEAGDVLVTSVNINGHTIIMIVLRSKDRFADTYKLLNMLSSDSLTYLSIHP